MHDEDGPGKKRKSKATSIATKGKSEVPENLHKIFDKIEDGAALLELGGIVVAPVSEGASLAVEPFALYGGAVGTFGNAGVDLYEAYNGVDGKISSAAFRVVRFGATFGFGKMISNLPKYYNVVSTTILKLNVYFYDKVVVPNVSSKLKL